MSMDQVNALCEQLVKAVTIMMDPSSTQRYRLEALKVAGVCRPGPAPRPSPSPSSTGAAQDPGRLPLTRPLDLGPQPPGPSLHRFPRLFPLPAFCARRACPSPGTLSSLVLCVRLISPPLPPALSSPLATSVCSSPYHDSLHSLLHPLYFLKPHIRASPRFPVAHVSSPCPTRPQHRPHSL